MKATVTPSDVRNLLDLATQAHNGPEAVMTVTGDRIRVQADPKLVPLDEDERVILTADALTTWLDSSTASDSDCEIAAQWINDSADEWLRDAQDREDGPQYTTF